MHDINILRNATEARAWLAGSAVPDPMIHTTSREQAERIVREGVRIDRTVRDVGWGYGFYASSRADPQYGDTTLSAAVRLRTPFIANDSIEGQEQIDALLRTAGSEDVHATLAAAGYDGVVVRFLDGEVWAIAYDEEQVRVIRRQRGG